MNFSGLHMDRIAGRFLTKVPASIDQGVRHLEPLIRERYAMLDKYGDEWEDKPVRPLIFYGG